MCGIGGIISKNVSDHNDDNLKNIVSSQFHRGPDGNGIFNQLPVSLSHNRLAIIDVETGKQPMIYEDNQYAITYNGELYNFIELRDILRQKGFEFKTNSDTEVVLKSYICWGEKCVHFFRGMFAFCVVDFKKQYCFLARDCFGIKPLVYFSDNKRFVFSSEIQALEKLDFIPKQVNLKSLDLYLWLSYIPAPQSIYDNIFKLEPANYLVVNFDGRIIKKEKYWQIEYKINYSKNINDWIEETGHILKQSVKKHLISDVPFGAFLSGGIDSTLVVKYMSELLPNKVKAFTIAFEEDEFNELPYAKQAVDKLNVEHHYEIIKPDALSILPDLVKHYGEPYADSSALPMYYVSKLAKKHVTMVLSGDGADECFMGYPRYNNYYNYINTKLQVSKWKAALLPFANKLNPKKYSPLYPKKDIYGYLRYVEYLKKSVRKSIWKKEYEEFINEDWNELSRDLKNIGKIDDLNRLRYLDMKSYMTFDILTKVDIASMMNSLEVRTPIIDKEVFEFSATIPPEILLNLNSKPTDKFLLKELLKPTFNDEFIHRKKSGFAIPLSKWFNNENGQLWKVIKEEMISSNSPILNYFDKEVVQSIINNQIIDRNVGGEQLIWQLLFLNEWLKNK